MKSYNIAFNRHNAGNWSLIPKNKLIVYFGSDGESIYCARDYEVNNCSLQWISFYNKKLVLASYLEPRFIIIIGDRFMIKKPWYKRIYDLFTKELVAPYSEPITNKKPWYKRIYDLFTKELVTPYSEPITNKKPWYKRIFTNK